MGPLRGNQNLRFSLAGLQAGMLASLLMLFWMGMASIWYRRSVWSIPNLLSSTFYGEAAFRAGFGRNTCSGIALHLFLYSMLGVLFGLIVRGSRSRLAVFGFGLLFAVLWYYVLFGGVWKAVNPLVALYIPNRPMLAGHFLYGAMLGRFPVFRDALQTVELEQFTR